MMDARRIDVSKPVVFVSDLGLRDEFVGVCHAVIACIAPGSRVIDISHGISPHDVRSGALILAESLPYAPDDAIGLGVVDPGAGTARLAIAVETAAGRLLVGPDNGLLSIAWRADGGLRRAVTINAPDVILQPVSNVFHGRDIFAPAAGHLAAGRDLSELGAQVDSDALVEVVVGEPEVERGKVVGEVLNIDRFGNVRLNVRPAHLADAGLNSATALQVATTGQEAVVPRCMSYGDVEVGAYGILIDAWGWMTIIRYEANAAADLAVRVGDPIWLTA
jgi:S-adenosyl-L-methionine hydrolase (adenosine-forming)